MILRTHAQPTPPTNTQEQQRRDTAEHKFVQATPTTSAGITQTPTATQTTAATQTDAAKPAAAVPKRSTKKPAASRSSKSKQPATKSGAKGASTAFVQRLKDRLVKTQSQLKQATAERDERRRNNYQLSQTNKRLMVRICRYLHGSTRGC